MKARLLLLGVSVFFLLVLAPAAALSQGAGTQITCGRAVIDGTVGVTEWADATKLRMGAEGAGLRGQSHSAQDDGATEGWRT